MIHHIQKHVMDILATADSCRYGQLKPVDMDGNVFTYHLKQLLRDNYIDKSDNGNYTLTSKGRDYIVNRYENPLLQAHSILLIVVRRGEQWLMRERLVQPLLGMTGFVHGEPFAGTNVVTVAQQRLIDKTGIVTSLTLHSSGLITMKRAGQIESYSHTVILYGETDDNITIHQDLTGRNSWMSVNEMSAIDVLPSSFDIIDYIEHHVTSPFDLSYDISER
ncbi:MAG: hypothetical protein ABIR91_00775 [Candidatus Saccharimonadales bacterium]